MPQTLLRGSYKFLKVFFGHVWGHKGCNCLYGHFSRKSVRTHQPEREQEHVHQHASFGLWKSSGSDSGSNIYGWICNRLLTGLFYSYYLRSGGDRSCQASSEGHGRKSRGGRRGHVPPHPRVVPPQKKYLKKSHSLLCKIYVCIPKIIV